MLRRRGLANQAAVAWVYPTTRAHDEEHKVHTLFAVSVLIGSRWTRDVVDLPFGPSLSLSVGVLVLLRAEGTRVQSRVALVLPRARGPLLHAWWWSSPSVCFTLLRVDTFPLCVLHVLSALSGGIVLLCPNPP